MHRRIIILGILLAMLLSACGGPKSQPATAVPTTTRAASSAPTQAQTREATEPLAPAQPLTPPGCTVISPQPTPGPTEQSLFPPAVEGDWVRGPEDAAVTIIEYSDYQ